MEENKMGSAHNSHDCPCAMHGTNPMWNPHRFMLLRLLLGIVILLVVFGIGMKIGEFKGMVESGGFGDGMYRQNMYDRQMYRMGSQDDAFMLDRQAVPTQVVPTVVPSKTVVPTK